MRPPKRFTLLPNIKKARGFHGVRGQPCRGVWISKRRKRESGVGGLEQIADFLKNLSNILRDNREHQLRMVSMQHIGLTILSNP
jgi:hypothetical protein